MPKTRIQVGALADSGLQLATTGFSFSHTCENQNSKVVLVFVGSQDATSSNDTIITGITYGGASMTQVGTASNGGGGVQSARSDIWILTNPVAGLNTVAISFTGTVSESNAVAATFWNVDQTTQQDVPSQNDNGNHANAEIDVTPVNDNALVIGAIAGNGAPNLVTPSSGATEIFEVSGTNLSFELCTQVPPFAPVSYVTTMQLAFNAQRYGFVTIALRPRRRHPITT